MLGGSLILRLVCLLCFLSPRAASQYRTYIDKWRRGQAGRNLRGNAFYSSNLRRNNSWLPQLNSMAFSYSKKNNWNHVGRRQDIYDGSDFDWDGFPVEDTPTWPPDYNSWPQTVTQAPPQVPPEYPQLVPTQAPFQAPYQVPSVMPTQMRVPLGSQLTTQAQRWSPRVKPQNNMKMPVKLEAHNASRVCSPGPPLGVNPLFRNCLVIGDSISLGYLTTVKGQLQGLCQVQHAPFAKGSGSVDSRYGLKCLSLMLRTTALEPTSYDAIVFNFGMHDINYSKMFPEEFVPLEEYGQNLMEIKELLLESGAQVAFALTTPVPIAGRRNERVVAYNKEARRVMEEGKRVEIVDLHSAVIHVCGEPPYKTCSIMRRPGDVHFNPKGNRLLGIKVGTTLRSLLSKAKPRGQFSPPRAPELSAREGLASSYLHDDTSFCPDMVTRCPARTTCCEDLLSLTGYGCCMHRDAVSCPDNWHCCPRGSHCSPDCNFRSCKCLFPSLHPVAVSMPNKKAEESKSHSESHSSSVKPVKESEDKKKVSKTEKEQKTKHKTSKHRNRTKSRKKDNRKSKHKLSLKDKKHEKHKPNHTKKERKRTKKLRSKAKDKGSKSVKLKNLKKPKAIQKMNKNVVKAHKTHQKTNFHPTTKQHWVAIFNDRLGSLRKHKPNIKFSHTWGKRKHQKLSYKSNRNTNNRHSKDASMADELKHLIVHHRKEKLRRRLKLHTHRHAKHNHRSHGKGLIGRRKQTTRKKQKKERTIQPNHTRNILKKHNSKSNVKNRKIKEHSKSNKMEENPSHLTEKMSGHENRVTVNVFDNLRQTLHEKVLAKENVSLKLDSSKLKGRIVEHLVNTTAESKTKELGKKKNDSILKSEETSNSARGFQITSSNEKMPLNTDKNQPQEMNTNLKNMSDTSSNASTNTADSENSTSISTSSAGTSTAKEEELSDSVPDSVSNDVTKGENIQTDQEKSRTSSLIIIKPNSSRVDERTAKQIQNRLEANGNVTKDTSQNDKALAIITAKNFSKTNTDGVALVTGMHSQARTDQVASGSALEVDEFSFGLPASGFEKSTTLSGDNEDSIIDEHIRLFLGGEDTAGSTNDLEKYEISKESSRNKGDDDGFYKTSSLTNPYAASGNMETTSGRILESFSAESNSDPHFGGESDTDEDKDADEKNFHSSGRDDTHLSGLLPLSGRSSSSQIEKFYSAEDKQSVEQENGDFSGSSSTDISQMRYNDWKDLGETYSGFGSGYFESSTDEWGSGEGGSSSVSFSTQAKPISLQNYTTTKNSNIAYSVYQNSGELDEEQNENDVASGENMNLEKRGHIFDSVTDDEKRPQDEKKELGGVKSLQRKHTEEAIDGKNNDFMSWEDKELEQLLYWLSIATDDDNNQFKQIMAHKDMGRSRPQRTSEHSRLQGMLLNKIFPDFSKNEREEFVEKNEKEQETFRTDAPPTNGSGIEKSN